MSTGSCRPRTGCFGLDAILLGLWAREWEVDVRPEAVLFGTCEVEPEAATLRVWLFRVPSCEWLRDWAYDLGGLRESAAA